VRSARKQLEMLWRASASWGEYGQVRDLSVPSIKPASEGQAKPAIPLLSRDGLQFDDLGHERQLSQT
jgi:hypothetical protein